MSRKAACEGDAVLGMPQVLQLSGIGPAGQLREKGIPRRGRPARRWSKHAGAGHSLSSGAHAQGSPAHA